MTYVLSELKRRKVIKVGITYAVMAFVTMQLAAIYAIVGNSNKVLDKIEYLSTIPNGFHYGELKVDPDFDSIRNEPRFRAVLHKLKPVS